MFALRKKRSTETRKTENTPAMFGVFFVLFVSRWFINWFSTMFLVGRDGIYYEAADALRRPFITLALMTSPVSV